MYRGIRQHATFVTELVMRTNTYAKCSCYEICNTECRNCDETHRAWI